MRKVSSTVVTSACDTADGCAHLWLWVYTALRADTARERSSTSPPRWLACHVRWYSDGRYVRKFARRSPKVMSASEICDASLRIVREAPQVVP